MLFDRSPTPATYDPNQLLDALLLMLKLKDDAALSRALNVSRPIMASIRQRSIGVGAWLLIRIRDLSGVSIVGLRRMMGDQRTRLRMANARIANRQA